MDWTRLGPAAAGGVGGWQQVEESLQVSCSPQFELLIITVGGAPVALAANRSGRPLFPLLLPTDPSKQQDGGGWVHHPPIISPPPPYFFSLSPSVCAAVKAGCWKDAIRVFLLCSGAAKPTPPTRPQPTHLPPVCVCVCRTASSALADVCEANVMVTAAAAMWRQSDDRNVKTQVFVRRPPPPLFVLRRRAAGQLLGSKVNVYLYL